VKKAHEQIHHNHVVKVRCIVRRQANYIRPAGIRYAGDKRHERKSWGCGKWKQPSYPEDGGISTIL
jgi:hypothetical protein